MSTTDVTPPGVDWETLSAEAVRHLQALLRCDTINPPGNEHLVTTYLRAQLEAEGIECQIIEPQPGRTSIWARLPGSGTARPLLLVGHADVVPVERERWSVDPFGGEIRDGFIYGRGAVDMKDMVALELTLLRHFARQARAGSAPLDRDLIMLVVADEEAGGEHGMRWIVDHRPELVDAEYALNEGGGMGIELGGHRFYLCEAAQKGGFRVTLRATGRPGHAAVPHNQSAVVFLARAIARLGAMPLPMHVTATAERFIRTIAAQLAPVQRVGLQQVLNPLLSEQALRLLPDSATADGLRAMLHNTASTTILHGGSALNVIPSEASAEVDVRVIPGQTPAAVQREIELRIGDPAVAVEVHPNSLGYEMRFDTPLFAAIQSAIAKHDPGTTVVPYLFPAMSDSRFLAPLGVIPYGFVPHRPEAGVPPVQSLAHGHDERVSVANIDFGVRVLHDVITSLSR